MSVFDFFLKKDAEEEQPSTVAQQIISALKSVQGMSTSEPEVILPRRVRIGEQVETDAETVQVRRSDMAWNQVSRMTQAVEEAIKDEERFTFNRRNLRKVLADGLSTAGTLVLITADHLAPRDSDD